MGGRGRRGGGGREGGPAPGLDTGALEAIIDALIAANPDQAGAVKEKPQAIGWFVGQVMKQTSGKANPGVINGLLKAKLGI